MLSKAQNKYIRSLTHHKFRNEYNVFIAAGEKLAYEWLNSKASIKWIVANDQWHEANRNLLAKHQEAELIIVKDSELEAISPLQTANNVLLVVNKPKQAQIPIVNNWYLALDDIQDPGNMGTMIRNADWFGIPNIICSPGCVDVYNPKVVQSAMGGHLRVNIFETELTDFLGKVSVPILAATLNGENVYGMPRLESGVLIIGNESNGVSGKVISLATRQVMIPRKGGAESLNAGVSAGILCTLLLPC